MKKNNEVKIENTEIQKLMDDLLNDYKNQLEEKRLLEQEQIKYIQEKNMILKNHAIPFYLKKHGCSSLSKQSMELLIQLYDGFYKCHENEGSELFEDSWREVDKCFKQLRKLRKPLTDEVSEFWKDLNEWSKLTHVHKSKTCGVDENLNSDDFVFYRDQFNFSISEFHLLNKEMKLQYDEYENSKKQLRRLVKKINHSIHRGRLFVKSETGRDKFAQFHASNPDGAKVILPPFLEWTDKWKTCKRNGQRSRTVKLLVDRVSYVRG